MDAPRVGAVIVNHDSGGTLLTAIRALQRQTRPLDSITVIDNNSADDTPARVRTEFPDVRLVQLKDNAGLSRARNLGLHAADCELILLVDDDVYLEADCLERMLAVQRRTGAAALCPRILFHPGNDAVQCDGAGIHFAGLLTLRNAGGPPGEAPQAFPTDAFIGACLLFDRKILAGLGGFDEQYFFYFEDLEISYRLRALGHTLICEPNAVARHERGAGTRGLSFRGRGEYPARRAYYVLRHRWLTILLHYQARTLVLLAPALVLYELASAAECVRRGWLLPWVRAAGWILWNAVRLLRRRARWQSLRCVPDRDILSGGALPFSAGFLREGITARLALWLGRTLNSYWQAVRRWL